MLEEKVNEVKVEKYKTTPLQIIVDNDRGYVALGGYRISPVMNSKKECIDWIKRKDLELMTTVIGIVGDAIVKNNLKFTEYESEQN